VTLNTITILIKIKEELSVQLFLLDELTEQTIHYPHEPPPRPRKEDTLILTMLPVTKVKNQYSLISNCIGTM
jgi:hypothetical protein